MKSLGALAITVAAELGWRTQKAYPAAVCGHFVQLQKQCGTLTEPARGGMR